VRIFSVASHDAEKVVAPVGTKVRTRHLGVPGIKSRAGPDVVQLSIGIEDKDDIIADLEQCLAEQ
jgi:O-acetylhomoserine/O-acetylserine sulfhydrylase-like pyridoxal-dependent enzyme